MNIPDKPVRGFTLVELLVVMSIIALLLSLLLPALKLARAQARTVLCSGAEHQIGLAIANYTTEHSGIFPAEFGYPWLDRTELSRWQAGISWQHCIVNPGNPRAAVTERRGQQSLTALRCPAWPKALGCFARGFAATGGYAINDNLDGLCAWQFILGVDPAKLKSLYIPPDIARVRNPSTKLCLLETTAIEDTQHPGTVSMAKDVVESWGYLNVVSSGGQALRYTYRGWLRLDHGRNPPTGPFTMKNLKPLARTEMMSQKLNTLFIDGHAETIGLSRLVENPLLWLPYR